MYHSKNSSMKKIVAFVILISMNFVSYGQNSKGTYTIQQLQSIFKHKNYTEEVLTEFQKTMMDLRERPQLNEEIPGEVISWFTLNGQFSWHKTFRIVHNKLKEVETIPHDENFLKKLNSYVPEKSKFTYSSDLWSFAFVNKKLSDNTYLIQATVKSFNSYPDFPNDDILSYSLEYKTKDFKTFKLVRLKDIHTDKWIEVDAY